MNFIEEIRDFYLKNLEVSREEGNFLKAPCPFCSARGFEEHPGTLSVYLNHESLFAGFFRCGNRCVPGGFHAHFGRLAKVRPESVPGFDPDREPYIPDIFYPAKNLNAEIKKFSAFMESGPYDYFRGFGVGGKTLTEMHVGYNGRYLVYPYFMDDGNCYAARCVFPDKREDHFWHGDEAFFLKEFRLFNLQDISRCEDGATFVTEGENNLLVLKEMGFPGVSVPSARDLEHIPQERFAFVRHVFLALGHTPEAWLAARDFATRVGYKVRILKWPSGLRRGYDLCSLAKEKGQETGKALSSMIKFSKPFSPFPSPDKERIRFLDFLNQDKGKGLLGLRSGFEKLDAALNGIQGINIMGGPPKAGKSCFTMQISTEIAREKTPVIYYDFENGRRKIYMRTLCRLSRQPEEAIRTKSLGSEASNRLKQALQVFNDMLPYFRVITDRKLTPEAVRRQIDFVQNETRSGDVLVVIDSLHKLPFQSLLERRTGIDGWLRHMEAIRDEQNASFLVISELSRDLEGGYSTTPNLGSFKESGDIEYSADTAMILMPEWNLADPVLKTERRARLWIVASRENSPGEVSGYRLEYPFWAFKEE